MLAYRTSRDPGVLGILYDRYVELIYGLCLNYLKDGSRAEDAAMDIYEQLGGKLARYEVATFRPWLYQLSRNHCLMLLRKTASGLTLGSKSVATQSQLDPADMQLADTSHLSGESAAEVREGLLLALERCRGKLPADQAECIRRFYLEGQSYAAIAAQIGVEVKTVRSRIQNGRRNLKHCMKASTTAS